MNRIDKLFTEYRKQGKKALVLYVTAGDPNIQFTEELVNTIITAGADIIEIGVPFSDPMADGPTIQAASERALKNDISLSNILDMVKRVRKSHPDIPLVLFSYFNPVLQYGIDKLAADSAESGIDGWLIVDLGSAEEDEVIPSLSSHDLHKITLLAPTSDSSRMKKLLKQAKGFVYYITVTGVTGVRTDLPQDLAEHLEEVASYSDTPLVAGFGVSTPEMARQVGEHTDGVVVGSKLVKTVAETPDRQTALSNAAELVENLAEAIH